jgi:hypothetical protein
MNDGIQKPDLHHGDMPSGLEGSPGMGSGGVVSLVRRNRTQDLLRYHLFGLELRKKELQEKFGFSGSHGGGFLRTL